MKDLTDLIIELEDENRPGLRYWPVTVAVNGVGHLHIQEVLFCQECNQFHITLEYPDGDNRG
jgi:hypothetical protein